MLANSGGTPDPHALERLNRIARNVCMTFRFGAGGQLELVPESAGIEQALGSLFAIVQVAMVLDTWPRLKTCSNEACARVFYDCSRNRSRRWCTMDQCGNLMRVRRYRQRRSRRRVAQSAGALRARGPVLLQSPVFRDTRVVRQGRRLHFWVQLRIAWHHRYRRNLDGGRLGPVRRWDREATGSCG